MGARNGVGIGLSDRSARLHRLAELILGIDCWVSLKVLKLGLRIVVNVFIGSQNSWAPAEKSVIGASGYIKL
jgi:hypothetical protein